MEALEMEPAEAVDGPSPGSAHAAAVDQVAGGANRRSLAGAAPQGEDVDCDDDDCCDDDDVLDDDVKQEVATAPTDDDEDDHLVTKQELSVIVPAHEDVDSQELLSPGKLSPSSAAGIAGMIDAGDFRALQPEPTYQTLTSVNGRMSPPGFSPSSSYATLTPLQPLPPISTMSDKFAYGHAASNVSGSFTVMQNNGLGGLAMGYAAYDKLPSMGMSPPHYSSPGPCGGAGLQQPLSPASQYNGGSGSNAGGVIHSPQQQNSQKSPQYDQQGNQQQYQRAPTASPSLSPASQALHSPTMVVSPSFVQQNGLAAASNSPPQHHSPGGVHRDPLGSPSPPAVGAATAVVVKSVGGGSSSSASSAAAAAAAAAEIEEINTKELAQRISAELKRRMWKWLQEPEFQRMSALRLAGKWTAPTDWFSAPGLSLFDPVAPEPQWPSAAVAAQIPQRGTCKRKEDPQTQQSQQQQQQQDHPPAPKKPRLVFTDLQRRTLQAIFKETKRPSKEMQVTIARQLGLEPTTVGNFFMNARRRSMDKWKDETLGDGSGGSSKSSPVQSGGGGVVQVGGNQLQTVTIHASDAL